MVKIYCPNANEMECLECALDTLTKTAYAVYQYCFMTINDGIIHNEIMATCRDELIEIGYLHWDEINKRYNIYQMPWISDFDYREYYVYESYKR